MFFVITLKTGSLLSFSNRESPSCVELCHFILNLTEAKQFSSPHHSNQLLCKLGGLLCSQNTVHLALWPTLKLTYRQWVLGDKWHRFLLSALFGGKEFKKLSQSRSLQCRRDLIHHHQHSPGRLYFHVSKRRARGVLSFSSYSRTVLGQLALKKCRLPDWADGE